MAPLTRSHGHLVKVHSVCDHEWSWALVMVLETTTDCPASASPRVSMLLGLEQRMLERVFEKLSSWSFVVVVG
jgi:hypothetical protein